MSKKKDKRLEYLKFKFEQKAAFKDPIFVKALIEEWDKQLANGKSESNAQHIMELWCMEKIRERVDNPPENPNFH